MADWKVSVEQIEVFLHPNAEKLDICKVGTSQIVAQKGLYKTGDLVAFVPEKSVLPESLKAPWEKYLTGSNKDRVKAVRLRGEFSCGLVIPMTTVQERVGYTPEIGVDISEKLSIRKYEPPIPVALMGSLEKFPDNIPNIGSHDCEHFRTYASEFVVGERVVVSEKLHGTQIICTSDKDGNNIVITSKGLRKNDLHIKRSETNTYWMASENSTIDQLCIFLSSKHKPEQLIRVFGEVIPCQKGYSYGQVKPVVKIFDIRVDNKSIPYDGVPEFAKAIWVPIIYDGPFEEAKILPLCEGNELVSGKELHIKEGVVIAPYIDRHAKDHSRLRLKLLNPKYKDDDESFN